MEGTLPFCPAEFENDLNEIRNDPTIEPSTELTDYAVSIGFHFNM
jgi:hypothetical protein